MNERIQELAEQAMVLDYSTWDSYNQKTVDHYKFDKEKFAELIIKECVNVIRNGTYLDTADPVFEASLDIQKHFEITFWN